MLRVNMIKALFIVMMIMNKSKLIDLFFFYFIIVDTGDNDV